MLYFCTIFEKECYNHIFQNIDKIDVLKKKTKRNVINYSFPDIKSILPEGGLIISSGKTCDGGKLPNVSSFLNTLIKVHSMRARIKKAKRFKNKSARF